MAVNAKAVSGDALDPESPWQTSSGLVDDVDAFISEPFFGVDEQYNADAMLFCAELIDPEGTRLTTLKFSVGKGWNVDDNGTRIEHEKKGKINKSSRFGAFIDRIAQPTTQKTPADKRVISPPGSENGLGLGAVLESRGSPLEAKSFDGLGFHWKLHKMPTLTQDEKGETVFRDVLFPVSYLGTWDDRQNGGHEPAAAASRTKSIAAPVKKPTASAPTQTSTETEAEAPDLPISLRKRLTPMAQSSTAKDFIKQVAKDKEVLSLPDDVMSHVLGGGPSGFWASVQE